MAKGRGQVKVKGSSLYVADGSATGSKVETLAEGLAQDTICGCGIECLCFGYLKIRNWNSNTGEYDFRVGYFVDGVWTTATQDEAEAEILGYKAIAGGLVRGVDTEDA